MSVMSVWFIVSFNSNISLFFLFSFPDDLCIGDNKILKSPTTMKLRSIWDFMQNAIHSLNVESPVFDAYMCICNCNIIIDYFLMNICLCFLKIKYSICTFIGNIQHIIIIIFKDLFYFQLCTQTHTCELVCACVCGMCICVYMCVRAHAHVCMRTHKCRGPMSPDRVSDSLELE